MLTDGRTPKTVDSLVLPNIKTDDAQFIVIKKSDHRVASVKEVLSSESGFNRSAIDRVQRIATAKRASPRNLMPTGPSE